MLFEIILFRCYGVRYSGGGNLYGGERFSLVLNGGRCVLD